MHPFYMVSGAMGKGRNAIPRDPGASIADMQQYSLRAVVAALNAGNGARR